MGSMACRSAEVVEEGGEVEERLIHGRCKHRSCFLMPMLCNQQKPATMFHASHDNTDISTTHSSSA